MNFALRAMPARLPPTLVLQIARSAHIWGRASPRERRHVQAPHVPHCEKFRMAPGESSVSYISTCCGSSRGQPERGHEGLVKSDFVLTSLVLLAFLSTSFAFEKRDRPETEPRGSLRVVATGTSIFGFPLSGRANFTTRCPRQHTERHVRLEDAGVCMCERMCDAWSKLRDSM